MCCSHFSRVFAGFCSQFLLSAWLYLDIGQESSAVVTSPASANGVASWTKIFYFFPTLFLEERAWKAGCSTTGIRGAWRFTWGASYSSSAPYQIETLKLVTVDVASLSDASQLPGDFLKRQVQILRENPSMGDKDSPLGVISSPQPLRRCWLFIYKHRSQRYIMPGNTFHRAQRITQKKRNNC